MNRTGELNLGIPSSVLGEDDEWYIKWCIGVPMKTYVCESIIEGVQVYHEFDCKTFEDAEDLAGSQGWSIIAEVMDLPETEIHFEPAPKVTH